MKHIVFVCLFWIAHTSMILADAPVDGHADEIIQIRDRLQAIEIDLARLGVVNDELGAVRRELSDALMQISNFLAVADRTLDAATASISAADAATNASQSYLAWTGIMIGLAGILAAGLTVYLTRQTIERASIKILEQLKKPSKVTGEADISIIDQIRRSVYDDLYEDLSSQSLSSILQNDKNLKMFKDLIEGAVEQKLAKMQNGGDLEFVASNRDQPS
jgi:hypothetical protein